MSEEKPQVKKTGGACLLIIAAIVGLVVLSSVVSGLLGREEKAGGSVMYICGYDRCKESGEYGTLLYSAGINAWNGPDPERGGVHHTLRHGQEVTVVEHKRVSDGPGGLWYKLGGGGWVNDFWLTYRVCDADNLHLMDFEDCMAGEY